MFEHLKIDARGVGLGCYLWLVLCVLLSGALYTDLPVALAWQIPLTLSCDGGALVAFVACLAAAQLRHQLARTRTAALVLACAISASVMLRAGMLFDDAPSAMVVGDTLLGAALALGGCAWWLALVRLETSQALLLILRSLLGASLAFIVLSIAPRGLMLLGASLGAPLGMAWGLAAHVPYDIEAGEPAADDPAPRRSGADVPLPRVLTLSVVLAVFVADLLLSLFPVSLFSEASPLLAPLTGSPEAPSLGHLTEPALIAAALIALFSGLGIALARRQALRLPLVCASGFFAVAVGFVTFPYHLPGGAPIGVAEAGRIVIFLFIIMALLLYYREDGTASWDLPLLRLACLCAGAMVMADGLVMGLYLNPALDLFDFTSRTVFGGAGLLTLVALLLGPMPHVYDIVRKGASCAGNSGEDQAAEGATERSGDPAGIQIDAFAEAMRLSPREREVLELISKGRDVPYIEQELVLSKSTVKTHIRHIYEKCGVSSRQALLDKLLKR